MVKSSLYQCKKCKTVFNATWYLDECDEGPWLPEWYYGENAEQKCPNCKSKKITFLGLCTITRKMRKQLLKD